MSVECGSSRIKVHRIKVAVQMVLVPQPHQFCYAINSDTLRCCLFTHVITVLVMIVSPLRYEVSRRQLGHREEANERFLA